MRVALLWIKLSDFVFVLILFISRGLQKRTGSVFATIPRVVKVDKIQYPS